MKRLLVALVGVAVALGAGIAYASIPDSSGVIHGCYSKSSSLSVPPGSLRVIDTGLGQSCGQNEGTLSWNQLGVKGATGPKGATGAPGPAELPDVWSDECANCSNKNVSSWTQVMSKALPAGTFFVVAKVQLNDLNTGTEFQCHLRDSSTQFDDSGIDMGSPGSGEIVLQRMVSLSAPATVEVDCIGLDSQALAITFESALDAVQVGTVH